MVESRFRTQNSDSNVLSMHHIPYPKLALYEVSRSNSSSLQESWRVGVESGHMGKPQEQRAELQKSNYAQPRQVLIQRFLGCEDTGIF